MPPMLYSLGSAVAFGAMGVLGKLAYGEGATLGTLLATRFLFAAALFWLTLVATGHAGAVRAICRRDLAIAVALGSVGYSVQASLAFATLERLDASLFALLLYTFPAFVTVAAILLGRESANWRVAAALLLASLGLMLVLAGASAGALDPRGAVLAFAAAVVYGAYIIVSDGVARRVDPLVLSALVCSAAGVSLTGTCVASGNLHLERVSATGFGYLIALALVSTVCAITLFFAGLRRIGATAASILSTLEPVVGVALAVAVFGESLGRAQLAGGALVLLAALAVRVPTRLSRPDVQLPTRAPLPRTNVCPELCRQPSKAKTARGEMR